MPIYVIFQDSSKGWRVQAVAVDPGSFKSRKALPEPFRGLRDDELSLKTGIDGCVFIHATGFIGGTLSFDASMKLARLSLTFI